MAHHGSAASTLNIAAETLRNSPFMGLPSGLSKENENHE
jgi:hypothetical protein